MSKDRNTRADLAQQTLQIIEAGHYESSAGRKIELRAAINASVAGTRLYREPPSLAARPLRIIPARLSVTAETTGEAIARLHHSGTGSLAALNFASARNPGGGFLGGAQAQEEALARASALYPTLLAQPEYYERNRANRSALYLDLAIFSPNVPFFRDDHGKLLEEPAFASIVTAPAPNAGAIGNNEPNNAAFIAPTLRRRAELVLGIAADQGAERLILGAWGCGVFRNDPALVAQTFAELLREGGVFSHRFAEVVFAIYDRTPERTTLAAFERQFS